MTNRELKRLRYLHRDIDRLNDRIAQLEDPSAPPIDGVPHSGGADLTARNAVRLTVLRLRLEAARLDVMDELQKMTEYIEGIDDPLMRQIMQYRHINGLSWERVAVLIGGGNTADSVRMAHDRYLADE